MSIFAKYRGSNKMADDLQRMANNAIMSELHRFGRAGVLALATATPVSSGRTANSWDYEIERVGKSTTIRWINTNTNNGANIAILLQYGHATGTGGYVTGRDYINPAIQPVMDQIAQDIWRTITS